MTRQVLFEFVWLPTFERTAKKLLTEEDRRVIEGKLCKDLEAGVLIGHTGGFRKLRYALEGRGKRGGARVIYFPDEEHGRVFMILAYAKGEKETLTREQENGLRLLGRELGKE